MKKCSQSILLIIVPPFEKAEMKSFARMKCFPKKYFAHHIIILLSSALKQPFRRTSMENFSSRR